MVDGEILRLQARRRVFEAVQGEAGIHLSEAARQSGLRITHARYHLDVLVRAGLIGATNDAGFIRYFARDRREGVARDVAGRREKDLVSTLRRARVLQICIILLARGPMTLATLADSLGRARPTVLFHVDRLVGRGVVSKLGDSLATRQYALSNPDEILAVLLRFPPKPSLIGSFVDLWDTLAVPSRESAGGGGLLDDDSVDARNEAVSKISIPPQDKLDGWIRRSVWRLFWPRQTTRPGSPVVS